MPSKGIRRREKFTLARDGCCTAHAKNIKRVLPGVTCSCGLDESGGASLPRAAWCPAQGNRSDCMRYPTAPLDSKARSEFRCMFCYLAER
jgi:hypothetical protein